MVINGYINDYKWLHELLKMVTWMVINGWMNGYMNGYKWLQNGYINGYKWLHEWLHEWL